MSYRTESVDLRYYPTPPGANNPLVGYTRNSVRNGGNWVPGELKSTPHPYTMSLSEQMIGYYKWTHPFVPTYFGYSHHTYTQTGAEFSANDQIKLINKLRDSYAGGELNAGNAIGELGQTVNTIASLLGDLRRALRGDLSHLNVIRKGNKQISDRWLEFQFGVKPIISDIYAAAEVASNFAHRKKKIVVSRKGTPGLISGTGDCTASGSITTSRRITAYFEQEASMPQAMGLTNPVGVAWELLPWSFVVDWVIPIGDFIAAQSFALQAKGTFITSDYSVTRISSALSGAPNPQGWIIEDINPTRILSVSTKREISSSLNVPMPTLKSSLLGGKPLERLANAASLLANTFGRSR